MADVKFSTAPVHGSVDATSRPILLKNISGTLTLVTSTFADIINSTEVKALLTDIAEDVVADVTTSDIAYSADSRTLTAVLADLYSRVGVIVDPDPDPVTDLVTEGFDNAIDDAPVSTDSTTADSHTGSDTLSHSSLFSDGSGLSLRVFGTDAETLRWENPTHTTHYGKWYYKHASTPSETAWLLYVYAANGTTVAYRVGVTSAGRVVIQNGTAGSSDETNFVLEPGKIYKLDNTAAGSGVAKVAIFNESNINGTSEVGAADVIQVTPLAASSFSDEELGLINILSGGGTTIPANLTDEGFNGTNGVVIDHTNTSADASFGVANATLKFNTSYNKEGTSSMRVNGTGYQLLQFNNASMNRYRASCYLNFVTAPGTNRSIFCQVRNGANTGYAFQMGIDTAGKLFIRNSTDGSGNKLATAATAFTTATAYRVEVDATGAGTLVAYIYRGATGGGIDSADIWQTVTMTDALTASNFANEELGQAALVATAADYSIDRWKSSNSGMPSPVGGGAGAPFEGFIERYRSSATSMPTNANIVIDTTPGNVNALLEPASGCWWGATAGPPTNQGGTTAEGLAIWEGFADREPDILRFYHSNAFTGPTSAQRALLERAGKPRAIGFWSWKIDTGLNMRQIANGGADARLNAFCTGMKQYPYKAFISLYHEQDNNDNEATTGNSFADYVAMWQHCVTYIRAQNVTNCVFVWNQTGWSGQAGTNGADYNAMYPGDAYVDWIASNPYYDAVVRVTFKDLVDENFAGTSGWNGFYTWATTNHPTKPIMLGEWGPDFHVAGGGLTDAEAAARLDSVGDMIQAYPKIKAMVHWNSVVRNSVGAITFDARIQGHALSEAMFAAVGALPWFNVGTENAP